MDRNEVGVPGTSGASGVSGINGGSGATGSPGADAGATAASPTDTTNTAEATGGVGGNGGNGGYTSASNQGGGRAGNGNDGGVAVAGATTTASAATTSASANATGGTGGAGGIGGQSVSPGLSLSGVGGNGGAATAAASDTNMAGAATATATSTGGTGGQSQYDVQTEGGGYVGNVYAGGAGGSAYNTTARAVGTTLATATVTQTGGSGGSGPAGGNGARSTLTNAVSGQTSGGTLNLTQTAQGGSGGIGGPYTGASGGDATSDLTVSDTSSISVSATANAHGGEAGEEFVSGQGDIPTGSPGNGEASVSLTGAANERLNAVTSATGGDGSVGGTGTATAVATGTGTTNVTSNAVGGIGTGQDGNAIAHATGTGSNVVISAAAVAGRGGGQGGAATALATGNGTTGTVSADASTALHVATSVSYAFPEVTATAPVSGNTVASAFVSDGGMLGAFDITSQSVSTAVLDPTAAAYGSGLPSTDRLLLETEEGGGSTASETGTATATAEFNDTYGLAALPPLSDVMLDLHSATLVGTGVTGVTFEAVIGSGSGAYINTETFTSGAAALAFFTDHVIDLGLAGNLTQGTNGINVAFILSVTTNGSNSGFYIDPGLGTDSPACYCRGTAIWTDRGDVPVEALRIGDHVVTASGVRAPVMWIGRRAYAGRFLAGRPQLQPIRFRAGSLGKGIPCRDLLVSPEHSMFLDELLVPARKLVNGATIVWERGLEQVEYFHIELDRHAVLLAEGAPSESFVDDDSRGKFHNADEWGLLYPGRLRVGAAFCAPRVESGPELEAIRRRLNAPHLTADASPIRGPARRPVRCLVPEPSGDEG